MFAFGAPGLLKLYQEKYKFVSNILKKQSDEKGENLKVLEIRDRPRHQDGRCSRKTRRYKSDIFLFSARQINDRIDMVAPSQRSSHQQTYIYIYIYIYFFHGANDKHNFSKKDTSAGARHVTNRTQRCGFERPVVGSAVHVSLPVGTEIWLGLVKNCTKDLNGLNVDAFCLI